MHGAISSASLMYLPMLYSPFSIGIKICVNFFLFDRALTKFEENELCILDLMGEMLLISIPIIKWSELPTSPIICYCFLI